MTLGMKPKPHLSNIHFRVDFSVLPLLFLGLFVFQLDRMNLASALTGGFATDINVQQSTINLGNQLMFMGIVVFEIPCNMAQQRVGKPHRGSKCYANSIDRSSQMDLGAGLYLRVPCHNAGFY